MNNMPVESWFATPDALMAEYERRTNTHDFTQVAPLIADESVFWFNDGSFSGKAAIRAAFERTWALIEQERYRIDHLEWIARGDVVAVCTYQFHWQGVVEGRVVQGTGRGTSVLRRDQERWQVAHEHLSPIPRD